MLVFADPPGSPLYNVRDAVLTLRQSVVVVDAGNAKLVEYSLDGRFMTSVGGKGSGPGEFNDLGWAAEYSGDTIAAYDSRSRAITLFDEDLEAVRSIQITAIPHGHPTRPVLLGVVRDGRFAGIVSAPPRASTGRGVTEILRNPNTLMVLSEGTIHHQPLGEVPGDELALLDGIVARPSFLRKTLFAVGGGGVFIVTTDSLSVIYRSIEGNTQHVISEPTVGPTLAPEKIVEARSMGLSSDYVPQHQPAVADMSVDRDGRLWIGLTASGGADPRSYIVTDPGGNRMTVRVPPRTRVLTARGDTVIAVGHGPNEEENVQLLTIEWLSMN